MNRKDALLRGGVALAGAVSARGVASASPARIVTSVPNLGKPLTLPKHGLPRVAVLIGPDTVAIDMIGPWEAFSNAISGPGFQPAFMLYTVAATMQPVSVEGLWVTPHYTFENSPQPHVIVIPQQRPLRASIDWVKRASTNADVTMSVCTGVRILAATGLLDGLTATTHHNLYSRFEKLFPKVKLIRGPRYVEHRDVSTAGGESSGIDLALRVVERYYGPNVAAASAYQMEHVRGPRPQSVKDV